MRQLSKRLIAGTAGVFCFASVSAALTFMVAYKPYGVSDHRRAEYEQKIDQLRRRNELIRNVNQQSRPKVVVSERTHDFGMLDPHTTATHTFQVSNGGDDPLALEVRETSCKCTVGDLQDSLLDPGESTTVTLTWNTGYKAEKYEQTATLVTNDPVTPSLQLSVLGEVKAQLIVPETVQLQKSDRAKVTKGSFVIYSQLWDDFEVVSAQSDLSSFEWHAEPIDNDSAELGDSEARSAWKVQVFAAHDQFGKFSDDVYLVIQPNNGGEAVEKTVQCNGHVRAPIAFISPDIHKDEGLDMGTVVSGKEHQFHVVVRTRDDDRKMEVLDVKPDVLNASIEATRKAGDFRLSVKVPSDCPLTVFNGPTQGYVQVGDPDDPGYSNWFPLLGAVVTVKQ